MNLDDFKTGLHDSNSPINQKEEERLIAITVEDFINDKNTLGAILRLEEVRFEVNILREYAKRNENVYLLKRLNKIYNQL